MEKDEETSGESRRALTQTFVVPGVVVALLLFVPVSFRGSIETTVAAFAQVLPVGYAFAAGMVASVNPCGVLLLPSYVLYQLKSKEGTSSTARRALRGIVVAAVVTAGLVLVLGAVGGVIAAGEQWLVRAFPFGRRGPAGRVESVHRLRRGHGSGDSLRHPGSGALPSCDGPLDTLDHALRPSCDGLIRYRGGALSDVLLDLCGWAVVR